MINNNFDFETIYDYDFDGVLSCEMFHCNNCGYHANYLCEIWLQGIDESPICIKLVNQTPSNKKTETLCGEEIETEDIMFIHTYKCIKCNGFGTLKTIPKNFLHHNGFLLNKREYFLLIMKYLKVKNLKLLINNCLIKFRQYLISNSNIR
jgi:hypothetical protein